MLSVAKTNKNTNRLFNYNTKIKIFDVIYDLNKLTPKSMQLINSCIRMAIGGII